MHKAIDIWLVGNTGLRNPRRIAEGFALFAASPFVGNLHGADNERDFMRFLHDNGIIKNETGKDTTASHTRKWRLMFARNGLIFPKIPKSIGHQEDLGQEDYITPFGYSFLRADTYPAQQECFLRAMSVEQTATTDGSGLFSPLRWILSIMLELERRTGSSELTRTEFALWGHTTDPTYELDYVVDHILDLRRRRKLAPSKRIFDRNEKEDRGKLYPKKVDNFFDYSDMNMRYLRITGILQRKGRGLIISPTKRMLAEKLASRTISRVSLFEAYQTLTMGAPLPSDNISVARDLLKEIEALAKARRTFYDISDLKLETAIEFNIARLRIEEAIQLTDEIQYAARQKNEWNEIVEYMKLIEKGGGTSGEEDQDTVIEVPKDETPAYLEWILWRASLAINHLVNKPYEVRGFKLDSDFLPVCTAGGGRGDLYCEFDDFVIVVEVSMSTSSRQEAMEGEPVRRHVSDAIDTYNKPVYGLFIAGKIDTNTAETFRHGVWYNRDDNARRLDILPLSLKQFREFFSAMFNAGNVTPNLLQTLIIRCGICRDIVDGPGWKDFIKRTVTKTVSSVEYGVIGIEEEVLSKIQPGALVRHPTLGVGRIVAIVAHFDTDINGDCEIPFSTELPSSFLLQQSGKDLIHHEKGHAIILGYKVVFGDSIRYLAIDEITDIAELLE